MANPVSQTFEERDDKTFSSKTRRISESSINETFDEADMNLMSSSETEKLNETLANMLITTYLPVELVETIEFRRLISALNEHYTVPSREYLSTVLIPKILANIKASVEQEISSASSFAFTIDNWSDDEWGISLISLTCYFIDSEFGRHSVVLAGQAFDEQTNVDVVVDRMRRSMFEEWQITPEQISVFVHGGNADIDEAIRSDKFGPSSIQCLALKMEKVLNEAVFEPLIIKELVVKCQSIVTHFNQSVVVYQSRTEATEEELVDHDVGTSWTSMLDVLKQAKELLPQLRSFETDNKEQDSVPSLDNNDVNLLEKLVLILELLSTTVKKLLHENECISVYIPVAKSLMSSIEAEQSSTASSDYVRSILSMVLTTIGAQFCDILTNGHLVIATFLDPRFRDSTKLLPAEVWTQAIENLRSQVTSINWTDSSPSSPEYQNCCTDKKPDCFWNFQEPFDVDNSVSYTNANSQFDSEINAYRRGIRPAVETSPYDWWQLHRCSLPILAQFARRYLAPPPISVFCEHLISKIELICYNRERNSLFMEQIGELLFANANFERLNSTDNE